MNQLLNKQNKSNLDLKNINSLQSFNSNSLNNKLSDNTNKEKGKNKITIISIISILSFLLLIFLLCTIFSLLNIQNNRIFNNISINGIDVSNLTKEEAKNKLSNIITNHLNKEISLKRSNFEGILYGKQFGINYNLDKSIDLAYSYGRSESFINNNFKILNSNFKSLNIPIEISSEDSIIRDIINNINPLLPDKLINSDYYVDNDSYSLILIPGKDGTIVDEFKFKNIMLDFLLDFNVKDFSIEIPVILKQATTLNIDEIHTSIFKPAINASYTINPYSITPSSLGIDFSIPIEDVKKALQQYKEKHIIPLKTLYPEISTNQINIEAFPNLLSSYSTSFSSSGYNRSTNISIASQNINGKVLLPGEIFSFNNIVGERTKKNGFKEATAYSNGKIIESYGGGICQVSSTLYNAVLYSNLEIIERTNHGYKPSYVKPGLDATVSWSAPDFKFKNNRSYPIKIITDTKNKQLKIYIYGLKTSSDYIVKLETKYLKTIPYKKLYQKDSSLKKGNSKILKYGSNGCKTATYKHLYDSNGNYIKSECISKDTYNPHNRIIAINN